MNIEYSWLHDCARQRFASTAEFEQFLPQPKTSQELTTLGDDRYLSLMTRRIFRAGMTHSVVDAYWPAFEEIFWQFDPEKMLLLSPERIEGCMQDERLIRHLGKLRTIPLNARMVLDVRKSHGSFGAFIAQHPETDITGLWQELARRGTRLGGNSAAAFLRMAGKDTFLLTSDVVAALQANGVIEGSPGSRKSLQAVQGEFNRLHAASGRPLCQLSAMLALTINPRF